MTSDEKLSLTNVEDDSIAIPANTICIGTSIFGAWAFQLLGFWLVIKVDSTQGRKPTMEIGAQRIVREGGAVQRVAHREIHFARAQSSAMTQYRQQVTGWAEVIRIQPFKAVKWPLA